MNNCCKHIRFLLFLFGMCTSCYAQDSTLLRTTAVYGPMPAPVEPVSQYIRRMFQDKNGNLWFGTNGDGVCRYDGTALIYFTPKDGLAGTAVRGIVEDKNGNLWFSTGGGISRYDGKAFTNFTEKDGLSSSDTWTIYNDRSGRSGWEQPPGPAASTERLLPLSPFRHQT